MSAPILKLSARGFCLVCLKLPDQEVADIAGMFREEVLPAAERIHDAAEEMVDRITPSKHTVPAHLRLLEIMQWAEGEQR